MDRVHSYDNLALEVWSVDAIKIKPNIEISFSPFVETSSVFWGKQVPKYMDDALFQFYETPAAKRPGSY